MRKNQYLIRSCRLTMTQEAVAMTMKKFQVELPEDMLEKMRKGYAAKRKQGGYEVKNISDEELAEYFMSMGLNYVDRKISEILDKENK